MKNVFWGTIDTIEYALKIVMVTSTIFFVQATLYFLVFLVGLIGGFSLELLIFSLVHFLLGFFLRFLHSAISAFTYGAFYGLASSLILWDMIAHKNFEGNNLLLPVIVAMAWLGVRAFQATLHLKRISDKEGKTIAGQTV